MPCGGQIAEKFEFISSDASVEMECAVLFHCFEKQNKEKLAKVKIMCKVSFVVPVYNVKNYLERCVKSILDFQDYEYEVILVDDGSTDGSGELADRIAKESPFVRVVHQENRGLSGARNSGMRVAEGEYIIFVDSDDYIVPSSIGKMVETADREVLDIGMADFCYVDENANDTEGQDKPVCLTEVVCGIDYLNACMRKKLDYAFISWRNIYRRSFLEANQLQFLEGVNHEDEEWTPRVFSVAQKVMGIEAVFYCYYQNPKSITTDVSKFEKNCLDMIKICKKHKEWMHTVENDDFVKLFGNRIALLYLSAVYKAKLIGKKYSTVVNKSFFKGLELEGKTRKKAALFCFNQHLYYYVNRATKKLSGK